MKGASLPAGSNNHSPQAELKNLSGYIQRGLTLTHTREPSHSQEKHQKVVQGVKTESSNYHAKECSRLFNGLEQIFKFAFNTQQKSARRMLCVCFKSGPDHAHWADRAVALLTRAASMESCALSVYKHIASQQHCALSLFRSRAAGAEDLTPSSHQQAFSMIIVLSWKLLNKAGALYYIWARRRPFHATLGAAT